MAARDFRDGRGRAWRAWEVAPDELSARTKNEDYLASLYYTGWIVFETVDGTEKRRLYPVPHGWSELPDPALEALLEKAEIVPPRGREVSRLEMPNPDGRATRTFRYPGGRMWAVGVTEDGESEGRPVLRFSAGARHVDLRDWPMDWTDYTEEDLVGLLRGAWPRDRSKPLRPGSPRRRWDDGQARQ